MGIRRNVSSGRPTEPPAIDSSSDVWLFTDEPMTDGYIFTTLQERDSDTVPSAALDIDSDCSLMPKFRHRVRSGNDSRVAMY